MSSPLSSGQGAAPDDKLSAEPDAQAANSAGPARETSPYAPQTRVSMIALAAILIYTLFDLLLPLFRFHLHRPRSAGELIEHIVLLELVPTAVFMLLQIWLARSLIALRLPWRPTLGAVAVSAALWFVTLGFVHGSRHMPFVANFLLAILRPTLLGLLLTIALTGLGAMLSRIIREPNVLLPVALIAMPIDYVGAMTNIGFTNTVVSHAPAVVQAVSVPIPHMGGLHPIALVGPGDALFMAFFFAAVLRLEMDMRRTFWWMFGLLSLAMAIVLVTDIAIAALVPMGIAVIVANLRFFKLRRGEVFAVIYASALVFVVVGVFYVVAHRYMTQTAAPPGPVHAHVRGEMQ